MSNTSNTTTMHAKATHILWSHHLQRRVMRLLAQLDESLFQGEFRTFYAHSTQPKVQLLQFYDRYLRLSLLSDELLDDIMPRVRREVSLQTDQITSREGAPTRGEIDWPRTFQRTMDELPGTHPILFDTMLREQNIATPENLLVIEILQHYHQALRETVEEDLKGGLLTDQERQQLVTIDERLERELSAPYARSLQAHMQQARDMDQMAEQVEASLRSGVSPYRDLVTWWEKFTALHIGNVTGQRQLVFASKRQDAATEPWLYELWLILELINLLHARSFLVEATLEITTDHIGFHFHWQQRPFIFHYQRQSSITTVQPVVGWNHLESVSAAWTIAREQPRTIKTGDTLIWQEPPLPVHTGYWVTETAIARSNAVQQLLGEMQVLGNQSGLLLTANLTEYPAFEFSREISVDMQQAQMAHSMLTGHIFEYQLTPDMALAQVQSHLEMILQQVSACLPERETLACHGIWLDQDNINASRDNLLQGNVLCPKPHLGVGVVDIVDLNKHCLKDPRICPAFGQPIAPPFVIRADTPDELSELTSQARSQSDQALTQAEQNEDEERAENLRASIFLGVGRSVERYVKVHGNTTSHEAQYEEWIFGDYWKKYSRCLAPATRNILLSAAYVWDEHKQTPQLTDWAAPAIQYCRALETEIKRRIHDYYPGHPYYGGFDLRGGNMTLGALDTIVQFYDKNPQQARNSGEQDKIKTSVPNWELCKKIVARSNSNITQFENELKRLSAENIVKNRNSLAHGGAVSRSVAQELRDSIIGHKGKPGVLCWLTENLEPKI